MYLSSSCLLLLISTVAIYADPQYIYGYPPLHPYDMSYQEPASYFRAGNPHPSFEERSQRPDNRFLLGTVTLTIGTTTTTTTITSSTTCTTSTGALTICSPSGRRRRSVLENYDSKKSRGLFHNEEEDNESIFYKSPVPAEAVEVAEQEPVREARSTQPLVPFIIQPGFNAPDGARGGRFLVAFGTSTSTFTTTSTYTAILTAKCASTSGFGTCSGSGK